VKPAARPQPDIAELIAQRELIRQLTREAHEVTKDLRQAIREARQARAALEHELRAALQQELTETIAAQLEITRDGFNEAAQVVHRHLDAILAAQDLESLAKVIGDRVMTELPAQLHAMLREEI
jgi:transposase